MCIKRTQSGRAFHTGFYFMPSDYISTFIFLQRISQSTHCRQIELGERLWNVRIFSYFFSWENGFNRFMDYPKTVEGIGKSVCPVAFMIIFISMC